MERKARNHDGQVPCGEGVEENIERLTEEIGKLVDEAPAEVRKELADFGIGALRGRLEDAVCDRGVDLEAGAPRSFNTLGLAIPLCLVGVLLLFLFPPVGVLLLLAAAAMLLLGVVGGLLFRET